MTNTLDYKTRLLQLIIRILLMLLSPILYLQAKRLKKSIPRLPEAPGARHATLSGHGRALNLLICGESTIAGVGANHQDTALTGQLARTLHNKTHGNIHWTSIGKNGLTAKQLHKRLMNEAVSSTTNIAIIALGVNDTLAFNKAKQWQLQVQQIIEQLQQQISQPTIIFCSVPNVGYFPALPHPAKLLFSLQSKLLNHTLYKLCQPQKHIHYCHTPQTTDIAFYASDGIHPNKAGYKIWAESLAECILKKTPGAPGD